MSSILREFIDTFVNEGIVYAVEPITLDSSEGSKKSFDAGSQFVTVKDLTTHFVIRALEDGDNYFVPKNIAKKAMAGNFTIEKRKPVPTNLRGRPTF